MTRKPAATIYDVAQRACVSISTVSRFLNTPKDVQAATAERIKTAMDELAYVRHGNAGTRQSRQNARIGVLAPFFPAPSFIDRIQGINEVFHRSSAELLMYSVDSPEQFDRYIRTGFFAKRLDGVIIMAMQLSDAHAEHLLAAGIRAVLIEQHHAAFNSIECDNVRGGALAGEYLVRKGYAPCAYLGQDVPLPYSLNPSALRLEGFSRALAAGGAPLEGRFLRLGEVSVAGGYAQAMELLSGAERPRSIFAMSDLQAFGAVKAARRLGLRVPEDIAIIGFDDVEAADYMELTTVSQELKESGRLAAELVLGQLLEPGRPPRSIQLRASIVERSTA